MPYNSRIINPDASTRRLVKIWGRQEGRVLAPVSTQAIQFDGLDDFITLGPAPNLSFTNGVTDEPFSVSAWVNISITNTGTIIGKYNANVNPPGSEWIFWIDNGQVRANLYDFNQGLTSNRIRVITTTPGGALVQNTWHHVVLTYDGNGFQGVNGSDSGLKIYVDNLVPPQSVDGQNYASMAVTNASAIIGSSESGALDFERKMADIAVFDKELSVVEVAEAYNLGAVKDMTLHSAYPNIISWWKMGDGDNSGPDGIIDSVGLHNGTLQGDTKIVNAKNLKSDYVAKVL